MFGFTPIESVVTVVVGADDAIRVALRADLADMRNDPTAEPLAKATAKHITQHEAKHVLMFTYTAQSARDTEQDAEAIAARLRAATTSECPVESFHVGGGQVAAYTCADLACCPKPLPEPVSLAPKSVPTAAEPFTNLFTVSAHDVARAQSVVDSTAGLGGDAMPLEEWRTAGAAHWDRLIASAKRGPVTETVSAEEAGAMLAYFQDRTVRDYAIMTLTSVYGQAGAAVLANDNDNAAVVDALDIILSAETGEAPDEDTALTAWTVLAYLASHAIDRQRAAAYAVAGLIAFWRDEYDEFGALVQVAMDDNPSHRFTQLLAATHQAGIHAGWVRRQDTKATG